MIHPITDPGASSTVQRIVAAVAVVLLIAAALASCGTIESGNVGMRTTLGKVNPVEVQHGVEDGKRGVYLPANGLLQRLARNALYEQAARIDSLVMHTRRDELAAAVHKALQVELDANDKGVFFVTRVVIRALTTDPAIEKAIQESVAAQKQLETTKQRIAIAEAQVEIKKAEGIAKANQIINQSLTREYLQHESNLALQKFAEKGGTSTVVIPANMQTAPLINIGAGK